jgi:hypothetical protein
MLVVLSFGVFTVGCLGARSAGPTGVLGNLDDALVEEITDVAAIERLDLHFDEQLGLDVLETRHHDLQSVPEPFRRLATERAQDGRVVGYATIFETGGTVLFVARFEAADGRSCDLAGEGDGVEVYTECVVESEALPDPVVEAVNELGGQRILRAAHREGQNTDFYRVEARIGDRTHALELTPAGEILLHDALFEATVRVPYLGPAPNAAATNASGSGDAASPPVESEATENAGPNELETPFE